MRVFLVLKLGMIHQFSYILRFEEHIKKNYAAFADYAAYLYSSYRSNSTFLVNVNHHEKH